MSVGSWQPETPEIKTLNPDFLSGLLTCDLEKSLEQQLEASWLEDTWVISENQAFWNAHVSNLENEQLVHLMKVFTLLETQLDNWAAGDKSAVIYIGKILKSRQAFPDIETVRWIKANSSNRFLPHGPILL